MMMHRIEEAKIVVTVRFVVLSGEEVILASVGGYVEDGATFFGSG